MSGDSVQPPPGRGGAEDHPVASCRLDAAGARAQRERYRQLGRALTEVAHGRGTLTARFSQDVDRKLLARTAAIERECCSFIEIQVDVERAALHMAVTEPSHAPMLESIAEALEVA